MTKEKSKAKSRTRKLIFTAVACTFSVCEGGRGRQVSDTKPKRPQWPLMSGASEAITTAVASWGHLVLLGDAEGNLSRWDTTTGKVSTIPSSQVIPLPPSFF